MAKKVCMDCPTLITSGARCLPCLARHETRKAAKYDADRPSPTERGYGYLHEKWRERVLARDPLCQGWPHQSGCGTRTTVADHIVPIRQGGKRLSMNNGRGMCEPCHNRKRQSEKMQYGR